MIKVCRYIRASSQRIKYHFIKAEDLNRIRCSYSNTLIDKIKMSSDLIKFICVEGYKHFKQDLQQFRAIKQISTLERTNQQQQKYIRIKIDLIKIVPVIIIFAIPMGGPLFFLYMSLFPTLIPTWVVIDTVHQATIQERRSNAIQSFKRIKQQYPQFQLNHLPYVMANRVKESHSGQGVVPNHQLRDICQIFQGYYLDGTYYYNHISFIKNRNLTLRYLLDPKISCFLMTSSIQYSIKFSSISNAENAAWIRQLEQILQQSIKNLI